jgi:hypothetical protein
MWECPSERGRSDLKQAIASIPRERRTSEEAASDEMAAPLVWGGRVQLQFPANDHATAGPAGGVE